ncbi:ATP-binding cassette domain-containing protein [Sphaerisporangium sp. NPDC004334]
MRLANLSFRYARRAPWVLHEVGLDLPPGTIAEVTGRNGAGKSTLLRLLAGTTPPTQGHVTGRPPVVGYAPEIFPVEQPFTVAAYLARMAGVRGLTPTAIDPWVERLGMAALLEVPLGDLSKGSAHKVGLAQALLAPPGLLILDEPFSGLDAQARAELPAIMEEVVATGGIVVVSDHQNGLAGHRGVLRLHVGDRTVRPLGHDAPSDTLSTAAGALSPPTASTSTPSPRVASADAFPTPAATADAPSPPATLSPSPSVTPAGAPSPPVAPAGVPSGAMSAATVVIEIAVEAGEAEAVVRKLRADGYPAVVRPLPHAGSEAR